MTRFEKQHVTPCGFFACDGRGTGEDRAARHGEAVAILEQEFPVRLTSHVLGQNDEEESEATPP
jgi:hypothetical protein